MKSLLAASLLILLAQSALSTRLHQLTVGDQSLIMTKRDRFVILNTVERDFITVTRNGNAIMETLPDCSKVFKWAKSMSSAERSEIKDLLRSLTDHFNQPIQRSQDMKFNLSAETKTNSEGVEQYGKWFISNWGPEVLVDSFKFARGFIEYVGNTISVTGMNLRPEASVIKVLFIADILVEVHSDARVEATPLKCLRPDRDHGLRGLHARLIELRARRAECIKNERDQLTDIDVAYQQEVDNLREKLESEIAQETHNFEARMATATGSVGMSIFEMSDEFKNEKSNLDNKIESIRRNYSDTQNRLKNEYQAKISLINMATSACLSRLEDIQ